MSHSIESAEAMPSNDVSIVDVPETGPSDFHRCCFNAAKKYRTAKIARMRAAVVKKQTIEVFESLERISFSYIGDTAFIDHYVQAKKSLEDVLGDFVLDDAYHAKCVESARAEISSEAWDYICKTAWV